MPVRASFGPLQSDTVATRNQAPHNDLCELPLASFDLSSAEIRERFEWAVRQGRPGWLWPDLARERWRNALIQIEEITRQILQNGRASDALDETVDAISVASLTSGMGPLLGYWAAMGQLQARADILAVLDLHYTHNAKRMEFLASRTIDALQRLGAAGVNVVVLKGMHTAFTYFPAPATRPVADIDLLINEVDEDLAGRVLRELDYLPGRRRPVPRQRSWRMAESPTLPRSLMLTQKDDPWNIDLQTELSRRYSAGAPMIELELLRSPPQLEPWPPSGSTFALRAVPLVLHLACHAGCGLGSLTLVRLTELVLVIRKGEQEGRFTWDAFMVLAAETGALPSAYPALRLAECLSPGTVPEEVLETSEKQVPVAVRRIIGSRRPADAQSVASYSLEERFMWTTSIRPVIRQVAMELFPAGVSFHEALAIYKRLAWQIIRSTLRRPISDGF